MHSSHRTVPPVLHNRRFWLLLTLLISVSPFPPSTHFSTTLHFPSLHRLLSHCQVGCFATALHFSSFRFPPTSRSLCSGNTLFFRLSSFVFHRILLCGCHWISVTCFCCILSDLPLRGFCFLFPNWFTFASHMSYNPTLVLVHDSFLFSWLVWFWQIVLLLISYFLFDGYNVVSVFFLLGETNWVFFFDSGLCFQVLSCMDIRIQYSRHCTCRFNQ